MWQMKNNVQNICFFVFAYLQCIRCKLYGKIPLNLLRLILCRLTQEISTSNNEFDYSIRISNRSKKLIMSYIFNLNHETIHHINNKPLHLILHVWWKRPAFNSRLMHANVVRKQSRNNEWVNIYLIVVC